jgi:hypothetical protein
MSGQRSLKLSQRNDAKLSKGDEIRPIQNRESYVHEITTFMPKFDLR